MNKTTILFLLVIILSVTACGQHIRVICPIPTVLNENSGMVVSSPNRIWFHNDGGDSAKLYLMDTLGVVLRTVLIQNVRNIDWEDITTDHKGNVFIGDFGNNNNRRKNLKVYKIPHPDLINGTSVNAEIINFSYPEQTAFPPPIDQHKFDAEAFVYYQDSLYIFTKDRTNPHLAHTWLYQIPAQTGTHTAVLRDSFHTQQISYVFEVTAASLSKDAKKLVLLGANRVWLFSNFVGNNFFGGNQQTILLQGTTQKEAIDFVDDNRLYFSNESSLLGAAELRELQLDATLLNQKEQIGLDTMVRNIVVLPNPIKDTLCINFDLAEAIVMSINLINAKGQKDNLMHKERLEKGNQKLQYNLESLPNGNYYLELKAAGVRQGVNIVIER